MSMANHPFYLDHWRYILTPTFLKSSIYLYAFLSEWEKHLNWLSPFWTPVNLLPTFHSHAALPVSYTKCEKNRVPRSGMSCFRGKNRNVRNFTGTPPKLLPLCPVLLRVLTFVEVEPWMQILASSQRKRTAFILLHITLSTHSKFCYLRRFSEWTFMVIGRVFQELYLRFSFQEYYVRQTWGAPNSAWLLDAVATSLRK